MSSEVRRHETGSLEDRMTCPYNTSHVMTGYRYQRHLIKCRKDNPEKAAKIKVCPYNQIHHIPADYFEKHLEICPQHLHFQRTVKLRNTTAEPKRAEGNSLASFLRSPTPPPPPTEEEVDEWQDD